MLTIQLNRKTHIYQEPDYIKIHLLKFSYLLIIFFLHAFEYNFKISFEI
jgi:hypothetical protein